MIYFWKGITGISILFPCNKFNFLIFSFFIHIIFLDSFSQIFFIPALKINFYLSKFKKYFAGRKLLIAKELTKIHEALFRENIDDLKAFKETMKGELTVIISEKNLKKKVLNEEKIVNKAKKYLKKYSLKDTVDLILESEKINKKKIYKLCLKVKNEKNY